MSSTLRQHARAIWQAAVDAAAPGRVVTNFLASPPENLRSSLERGARVVVVGGGKASGTMAAAVESALGERVRGVVNVPATSHGRLSRIVLHAARPAGSNQPTAEGVAGVEAQLALVASMEPEEVGLCLLSGGGSALLPAPVPGVSLEDKQTVTRLLHACGATIDEMNCVRKHLSRYKGGRLAQAFAARGCPVHGLILSDVVGDPLDVIASGPTAPDPTTFADALEILRRFSLRERTPPSILSYLERGRRGEEPETLKTLPPSVFNHLLCNNRSVLNVAAREAQRLGYRVLDLGSFLEGETRQVAVALAGIVRSICRDGVPFAPPVCILSGGETTVTLSSDHGKGGRNQEFVLAALAKLGPAGMQNVVVLSGGTDGEDGPTDAAGAIADAQTLVDATALRLPPNAFLERHDAYGFFAATDGLLKTGLTQTNVMDVRVILCGPC